MPAASNTRCAGVRLSGGLRCISDRRARRRSMPDDRYTRWVDSTRRNIFYILGHRLKEPGLIIESQGSTIWQNKPVDVVDFTDADNHVVTGYFEQSTKLPIRQVSVRRDPKTKERIEDVAMFTKFR